MNNKILYKKTEQILSTPICRF